MAWAGATPTFLTNGSGDTGSFGNTIVTDGSVSPTAGALLFAVVGMQRAGGDTSVSSIAQGFTIQGSWTICNDGSTSARSQYTGGSSNPAKEIWWALADATTPGSGTVTATTNVSCPRRTIQIIEVASGFNATPIAQCDNTTATTTTSPSGSFGTTPGTDNLLIAAIWAEGSSGSLDAAPGSGWTELNELTGSTDHNQVQWADGSNGVTYNWSGLDNSPTEQAFTAIEIAADAASGPSIPVLAYHYNQMR